MRASIKKGEERKKWLGENRAREHQNDLVRQYRDTLNRDAALLGNLATDENSLNAERQMGRVMTFAEIKGLIGRLNPQLMVVQATGDKAWVLAPMGDGKYKLICPFEYPISPEWSVSEVRMEEMPVGDLPEVTTSLDQLMMEPVPTHGREVVRGWRTLFARLVLSRWISLEVLEQSLPPEANPRASWRETLKGAILGTKEFAKKLGETR